jgi:hypothetical protein
MKRLKCASDTENGEEPKFGLITHKVEVFSHKLEIISHKSKVFAQNLD